VGESLHPDTEDHREERRGSGPPNLKSNTVGFQMRAEERENPDTKEGNFLAASAQESRKRGPERQKCQRSAMTGIE